MFANFSRVDYKLWLSMLTNLVVSARYKVLPWRSKPFVLNHTNSDCYRQIRTVVTGLFYVVLFLESPLYEQDFFGFTAWANV